ncbi:hypothetical protein MMC25_003040 [Agyrium rufum]|nr:hypothetical protein [Agyrium rufum]
MADITPQTINVLKTVGLTMSGAMAGAIFSFSYGVIPVVLEVESTTFLTQQWYSAYKIGKTLMPKIVLVPTLIYAYLGYASHNAASQSLNPGATSHAVPYGAAALLTIGIVPWTIIAMKSTNSKLESRTLKKVEKGQFGGKEADHEDVVGLVRTWTTLNYGRASLPFVGTLIAAWTALQ